MSANTPLVKNNRFDILKSENSNPFMQRRTRSSPSLRNNYKTDGSALRRINSAKFETRTMKKYKVPLNINNINAFPSLEGSHKIITKIPSNMNFFQATQNLNEEIKEATNTVKEGWVNLSKTNKGIKMEYGPIKTELFYEEEFHDRAQRYLYSLVVRWQNERDELNDLLGDMSPYWNEPSLLEPIEDEYNESDDSDN